jgi:hypothetical protein
VPSARHAKAFKTLCQAYATPVVTFLNQRRLPGSSTGGADEANALALPEGAADAGGVRRRAASDPARTSGATETGAGEWSRPGPRGYRLYPGGPSAAS